MVEDKTTAFCKGEERKKKRKAIGQNEQRGKQLREKENLDEKGERKRTGDVIQAPVKGEVFLVLRKKKKERKELGVHNEEVLQKNKGKKKREQKKSREKNVTNPTEKAKGHTKRKGGL